MSKFLVECINFINKENEQSRKDFRNILMMSDDKKVQEGTCILGAKKISHDEFSFSPQFLKIKEESTVYFYENKEKVGSAEVVSVDFIKNTIKVDFEYFNGDGKNTFIIQENNIYPKNIVNSLMEMNENPLPLLVERIIKRESNINASKETTVENVIKTANEMDNSFMILHGAPGAGKTYTGKKVIADLLKKGKKILVTSNSHSAINNLLEAIEIKDFKGAKICSKPKHKNNHESIKNISVSGNEIDGQVSDYNLVAGTCFALSRIKEVSFDYLIVDEASQIKLSFVLSILRNVKNVIIMGDHLQLTAISPIEIKPEGDAVLNYILEKNQILPQKYGYFLDTTFRCEPQIAKVVSDVFYEGKLKWNTKQNKNGIKIVTVDHNLSSKMNEFEGKAVLKIYKSLLKKGNKPEDIMVIAPYNAQVAHLKSLIKNDKVMVGSSDLVQGRESKEVIISLTVACKSQADGDFSTNPNRVNVSLSRAINGVHLVMSKNVLDSEFIHPTFKKVISMAHAIEDSHIETKKKIKLKKKVKSTDKQKKR